MKSRFNAEEATKLLLTRLCHTSWKHCNTSSLHLALRAHMQEELECHLINDMRSESGCSFLLQRLSLDSQFVNKRRGCRRSRRSDRLRPFATTSFNQTRNMPVTDKA